MDNNIIKTNATESLIKIINIYNQYLPSYTYPWVILCLASIIQFFAWFGGRYLFPNATLIKRIFFLWLIAALEFIVLIPGIGASAEILGYSESFLAIIFHAFQLGIFFILNKYTLKAEFNNYHMFAFILMGLSIIIISYTK
jgi:hypothetical protein